MRASLRLLGLTISVFMLYTSVSDAAPIRWRYEGTVPNDVADIEAGSLIRAWWSFDSAEPNQCSNGRGLYENHALKVAIGDRVWRATGVFHGAARFIDLCDDGELLENNEVRWFQWSGPDLPGLLLVPLIAFVDVPPGLYFDRVPPVGTLPTSPPPVVFFEGPRFLDLVDPDQEDTQPFKTNLHFVPEPAIGSLLAAAGLAIGIRKRQSRTQRQ